MNKAQPIPPRRLANRAQVAAFFGVALTTVDAWVIRGAPIRRHGSKGIEAEFDLRELALWHYAKPKGNVDYDALNQAHVWLQASRLE